MKYIFWGTVFSLAYIYMLYISILYCFTKAFSVIERPSGKREEFEDNEIQKVSVIIAVHNEEMRIRRRIENILDMLYPELEIIVASDGSTDRTNEIAKEYAERGVVLYSYPRQRGVGSLHNDTIPKATADIIILTDCDTLFSKDFAKRIVNGFNDPTVGCCVGRLRYFSGKSSISISEGLFFRYETIIRKLESRLGLLNTGSGACLGFRKDLFRYLNHKDGADFIVPLDVIIQNYRVVFVPDAVAYDEAFPNAIAEIKGRIRMTSRNLVGTLRRWRLNAIIKHPFISWSIFSHKILRWMTPFFMIAAFVSNAFVFDEHAFYQVTFFVQVIFYLLAIFGLLGELVKIRVPIISNIFSFCVANIGMGIGVVKGIIGMAPSVYREGE